jgi:hypothetical protein
MTCDHPKDKLADLRLKKIYESKKIHFPQFEKKKKKKKKNLPAGKHSPRKKTQLPQFLARGGS